MNEQDEIQQPQPRQRDETWRYVVGAVVFALLLGLSIFAGVAAGWAGFFGVWIGFLIVVMIASGGPVML